MIISSFVVLFLSSDCVFCVLKIHQQKKMEFPDLGKQCTAPNCNRLGLF